jgi:hypothetical protein
MRLAVPFSSAADGGVNNAPQSRQRRRRIDGLAGRDTTPDASMIQKSARNKGVSESGGRRRCVGVRVARSSKVFTLKKELACVPGPGRANLPTAAGR